MKNFAHLCYGKINLILKIGFDTLRVVKPRMGPKVSIPTQGSGPKQKRQKANWNA
ncbi:hypothetical protein NUZ5A_50286 [Candidatus Nitrosotenuis uzonensis]|uniref:Uncharacterized protein n=1 Tax=Candidatus Nitrosotenuis uzonensis TaxID=1407055 RepID=A0A812EWJ8_9ARCH|nr:hypothetical protein NUZ5A_50286 [Candidatus Nitrosotenuis uzonensis]